jgi:hypothetical protein
MVDRATEKELAMRRLMLLVCLAAMCGSAAMTATAGAAVPVPRNYNECYDYLRTYFGIQGDRLRSVQAEYCEILIARRAAGVTTPIRNGILGGTALAHDKASVAAHSWDRSNGLVSHLNPGTPVPSDQQTLQNLVNQQVDARIRGAGYCANGSSYADAEITYADPGKRNDAMVGAIRFWKTDPPHRAVLLDPKWTDIGIAVVSPSAFPGDTTGSTYVVDLGMCK